MKKNIFIGVDGGATKTHVIVVDDGNNLLGEALGGPSVIRFDTSAAWQEILKTLDSALKTTSIRLDDEKYCFHAGMGITGCEIKESHEKFVNTKHPFHNLLVLQDSYTACIGAHGGQDGAIVIIGTGVVGIAQSNDKIFQVSGWGFPHDDKGSGAWFGLKAVSLTMQHYDGRFKENSELFNLVLEKFDNDFSKLVTWANNARPTHFASIAPLVIKLAEKKDKVALDLLKRAAKHVDEVGLCLLEKASRDKKIPCALFGGISGLMENYLSPEFRSYLVKPKYNAAMGAVLAIKKKMNDE